MESYIFYLFYFVMAAAFVVFFAAVAAILRPNAANLKRILRLHAHSIIAALAVTVFVAITVPAFLRVLPDEALLASASRSMVIDKRIDAATEGVWFDPYYTALERSSDHRPLAFPFLAHLLHSVTGYRINNLFLVNYALLFMLLLLLHAWVRHFRGPVWASAAILIAVSNPVLTEAAGSAGHDLTYAVFLFASLGFLWRFLRTGTRNDFLLLWLSFLPLVYTRYEAAVFIPVVLAGLIAAKRVRRELFTRSTVVFFGLSPLLTLPVFWQRWFLMDGPIFKDEFYKEGIFSVLYLFRNHLEFFKMICAVDQPTAISCAGSWLGIAGCILVVWRFFARKKPSGKPSRDWILIAGAAFAVLWLTTTGFRFGQVGTAAYQRYFIPFIAAFSLAGVYFMSSFSVLRKNVWSGILVGIISLFLHHPAAMESLRAHSQNHVAEWKFVSEFCAKQPARRFLVAYRFPELLTSQEISAVSIERAVNEMETLLEWQSQKAYDEIYIVQRIRTKDHEPSIKVPMMGLNHLSVEAEFAIDETYYLRISRVANLLEGTVQSPFGMMPG